MSDTIPFEEEAVKEYLDRCIYYWRERRNAEAKLDLSIMVITSGCYIDAYQSLRVSLFRELLEG